MAPLVMSEPAAARPAVNSAAIWKVRMDRAWGVSQESQLTWSAMNRSAAAKKPASVSA